VQGRRVFQVKTAFELLVAKSHSKPPPAFFFFFAGSAGSVAVYQTIELVINKLKIFAVREDYI
jgi:hypothetical protein